MSSHNRHTTRSGDHEKELDRKSTKHNRKRHLRDEENDLSDNETKEEREKRREAKKVAKVAKMLGYSNDINPFGDSNLLQPFIWGKKKEKEKQQILPDSKGNFSTGRNTGRSSGDHDRLELISEIEKVRKRREDREAELAEMERLRDEEQRLREAADYHDWQHKEEKFVLEQTSKRSKIRLLEQREKPVDIIAKNILLVEVAEKRRRQLLGKDGKKTLDLKEAADEAELLDLDGEMQNPVELIAELQLDELKQLLNDVQEYAEWEKCKHGTGSSSSTDTIGAHSHEQFWEALKCVLSAEIKKLKLPIVTPSASSAAASAGVVAESSHSSMHESIANDVAELLNGKTVAELDDLQHDIEKNLREGRSSGDVEYWELLRDEVVLQRARSFVHDYHVQLLKKQLELLTELRCLEPDSGAGDANGAGAAAPRRIRVREEVPADEMDVDKAFENAEREEKMESQDEVLLPGSTYWWQDKYRPRKPRYFNHVKTGWDRTKYNLTHYDHDNPPPKMIKGYKFTIFYPDLIDKFQTPKYFLEPCTDGSDFAIIRFHAGPPYEDVAFKIINKEWDTHRRSGFYSVYDRGVLRLNFNFVRRFYRR